MDIFSHAAVGISIGLVGNDIFTGVLFSIAPDFVLIGKRRKMPSVAYNYAHSFLALLVVWILTRDLVAWTSIFSHLFLDLFTHGPIWGPPLLYPFWDKRFSFGEEWEFRNRSWYIGIIITIIVIFIFLTICRVIKYV